MLVSALPQHVLYIRDGFTLIGEKKSSHSLCSVPVYTFDCISALSLMLDPTLNPCSPVCAPYSVPSLPGAPSYLSI